MSWLGDVRFGGDFIVFSGRAGVNVSHQFPAAVLLVGRHGDVTIFDGVGEPVSAPALLLSPMTVHQVAAAQDLGIVFFHNYSRFSSAMLGSRPEGTPRPGVRALLRDELPVRSPSDVVRLSSEVDAVGSRPRVHPVVTALLDRVSEAPGRTTMQQLADEMSISTSWLRELVARELGAPMSGWLLWRKTELAGAALARGASLAEAAVMGGFADQAHFTRSLKRQLGIVPSQAAAVLR
ncbi:MAG: helix-turn-helix domain-containing protein [Ilumatobacter sp.]